VLTTTAQAKPAPNGSTSVAPTISPAAADMVEPARTDAQALLQASNGKKLSRKEQKQQLKADMNTAPILAEILRLKWEIMPSNGTVDDTKKMDLDQVFHETLAHSIPVRQAEVQIRDAQAVAKETRDPIFNPLNPFDPGSFKQAAEGNVKAAQAHLETVHQQELLQSAKLYGGLTQAFLSKYLAFQAIEQGRSQLKEEQSKFIAGETNRFDVTQTQMALIDRYSKYMEADNAYHAASMLLGRQINVPLDKVLVPEHLALQEQNQSITLLKLLPERLDLEQVLKSLKNRPDVIELQSRKDALQKLVKASSGVDKQKHKAELHQLELEGQKLSDITRVTAEKAFLDYQLAVKSLDIAQQRNEMANHYIYQLQLSHTSGFSSAKDLLDGQIEMAKVKTALVGAQVAYNLSQIQLLFEMGQLKEDVISHPQPSLVLNAAFQRGS